MKNKQIAIIPGSFKPPHKGHWEMIMQYINMSDKVIVLISNISTKAISKRNLSAANLKNFDKIVEKINKNEEKTPEIDEILIEIDKKRGSNLSFNDLKKYLEKLKYLISDNEIVNSIDNYIKLLTNTLFKSVRKAGDIEIEPEISKEIFEIFASTYGVSNKIEFVISSSPSPMSSVYDYIESNCKGCDIILGITNKPGDNTRITAYNHILEDLPNKIEIIPISVKTQLSATDLRNNIHNLKREYFPDKLSDDNFTKIQAFFN